MKNHDNRPLAGAFRLVAGAALALLPLAGCFTTQAEGQQMRSDLDRLTKRFDDSEREREATLQSYQDEVQKLHDTLSKASDLMARNAANVGQQVQDLQAEVAELRGLIDGATHNVDVLQKQLAEYETRNDSAVSTLTKIVMAPPASAPTVTADSLFAQAYKEYTDKKYIQSRKDFRDFLLKYPFDPRAANAQFWIADAFDQEANFAAAIPEYQKVLDNYPSSDLADQAMYKEGDAFFQVKWCTPALAYLKDLPKKYPQSSFRNDAKKLATRVARAQEKRGECTR